MPGPTALSLIGVTGLPLVRPGDDLVALIAGALAAQSMPLADDDVVVVTSKIVSKAEGRFVDLATVTPSSRARTLAAATEKDPRLVELVLRESTAVSRARPGILIVRHRLGFTSSVAGIDHSNVDPDDDLVLLLPEDPDASAGALLAGLEAATGRRLAVVVTDTHGRPFRRGNIGVAIGVAGLPALLDLRGDVDLFGHVLKATEVPLADMVAAAAGLIAGETVERVPVVVLRGLALRGDGRGQDLVRAPEQDLYGASER
ncbi:MAG TPA: coenzyme F420-0:L-glutamate ligase [Candidatus Dormibacteraeota bacterium]|jgi:coenzyme F420-0:L-glutamate ligase/coenzyme F420-1:gamma-L-glutamate ligase